MRESQNNGYSPEIYNDDGRVRDPKVAEEMAYVEKPFREKRILGVKPTKIQIGIGERLAEKAGTKKANEIFRISRALQLNPESNDGGSVGSLYPWKEGTIVHPLMAEGGRDISCYERQLQFDRHELEGKSVLDLGAGPEVKLAKGLRDSGIFADVTSLSPDFGEEIYVQQAKASFPEARIVTGQGEKLPFQDETFDVVFAFHVYEHLQMYENQLTDIISEMARILKVGGRAIIGPMNDEFNWKPFEAIISAEDTMNRLNGYHVQVTKEIIPEEILKKIKVKDGDGYSEYEVSFNLVLRKTDQD